LIDDYFALCDRTDRFQEVGIAGIKDFRRVKCLHTHYSHFLCRPQDNNIIGRWVQEELDRRAVTENGVEDEKMRQRQVGIYNEVIDGCPEVSLVDMASTNLSRVVEEGIA
jgi:hypothetical protein